MKFAMHLDLDETWMSLKLGLDHIMIHGTTRSIPDYTTLYSTVYNYCTSAEGRQRADGNKSMLDGNTSMLNGNRSMFLVRVAPHHSAKLLVTTAGDNLQGSDLYSKLSTYYIELLKPIIAVSIVL